MPTPAVLKWGPALVALALAGCTTFVQSGFDGLERRVVYRPDRRDDEPAPTRGVEWATFQVERVAYFRRSPGNVWLDAAGAVGAGVVRSVGKATCEAALDSAFDSVFDDDEEDAPPRDPWQRRKWEADREAAAQDRLLDRDSFARDDDVHRGGDSDEEEPEAKPREERVGRVQILRLHGAYVEAPRPAERRAVALYCHGSRGSVDDCVPRLVKLAAKLNIAIFGFDYRGYGRSEGEPYEAGLYDDARAARAWLAKRANVNERDVVLIGSAFGSAVAVELAATAGCRGLILENAFTSLGDVADGRAIGLKPSRVMIERYASIYKIHNYSGPLLQCHGDSNDVVPLENGRRLFNAAPGSKRFVVIPGGEHDEPPPRSFTPAMDEFLAFLPPETPRVATAAPPATPSPPETR